MFPLYLVRPALEAAKKAVDKGKRKANLTLPVDKVGAMLKEVLNQSKFDDHVNLHLVAVLERIAMDIFKVLEKRNIATAANDYGDERLIILISIPYS